MEGQCTAIEQQPSRCNPIVCEIKSGKAPPSSGTTIDWENEAMASVACYIRAQLEAEDGGLPGSVNNYLRHLAIHKTMLVTGAIAEEEMEETHGSLDGT